MTNALRLSAGVAGLAKVGVVNCEEEEAQVLNFLALLVQKYKS